MVVFYCVGGKIKRLGD